MTRWMPIVVALAVASIVGCAGEPSIGSIAQAVETADGGRTPCVPRRDLGAWDPEFGICAWGGVIIPGFASTTCYSVSDGTSNMCICDCERP